MFTTRLRGSASGPLALILAATLGLSACATTGEGAPSDGNGDAAPAREAKALPTGMDAAANPDPYPSTYRGLPRENLAIVGATVDSRAERPRAARRMGVFLDPVRPSLRSIVAGANDDPETPTICRVFHPLDAGSPHPISVSESAGSGLSRPTAPISGRRAELLPSGQTAGRLNLADPQEDADAYL